MPKALCIASMVFSILVLVLCLSDLILGLAGMDSIAPFKYFSMVADIIFVVVAGGWAYLSWVTYREQV